MINKRTSDLFYHEEYESALSDSFFAICFEILVRH